MDKEFYWLWLCNINGIWNGTIKKLLSLFGTPQAIYKAGERELTSAFKEMNLLKGDNKEDKNKAKVENKIEQIVLSRSYDSIMKIYDKLSEKNIRFVSIENKEYPAKLKNIKEPPYGLYLNGKKADFSRPAVAVVGARNCTLYGRKIARKISFELAAGGVDIISGMARGIDGESHFGAMDAGGITYAVMGCGADICYPRENIELYERIRERGAVISEYPIGTEPEGFRFPLRNRIISGLADLILVVEAREKSGSLITADYGLEQGKDIFAVPGRIGDALSEGCNSLIKEGAGIALSADEILRELGIVQKRKDTKIKNKKIVLEKDLETLYSYLDFFPKNVHMLMNETGKDSIEILRDLVKLQMMGLIEEPSKNYYSKKT